MDIKKHTRKTTPGYKQNTTGHKTLISMCDYTCLVKAYCVKGRKFMDVQVKRRELPKVHLW